VHQHNCTVSTPTARFYINHKVAHQLQISKKNSHVQPTALLASNDQAPQGWTRIACKGIRTTAYKRIKNI
jgi:hypothetical protein